MYLKFPQEKFKVSSLGEKKVAHLNYVQKVKRKLDFRRKKTATLRGNYYCTITLMLPAKKLKKK